jgi:hypothetical protein
MILAMLMVVSPAASLRTSVARSGGATLCPREDNAVHEADGLAKDE